MKMYSLKFTLAFSEKVRDENIQDLRRAIIKFEDEFYRTLPMNFEMNRLVSIICEVFSITEEEYHSNLKYGQLGIARQVVCFVLSLYNVRSREISQLTGYSQPRVIGAVKRMKMTDDPEIIDKIEQIVDKLGG